MAFPSSSLSTHPWNQSPPFNAMLLEYQGYCNLFISVFLARGKSTINDPWVNEWSSSLAVNENELKIQPPSIFTFIPFLHLRKRTPSDFLSSVKVDNVCLWEAKLQKAWTLTALILFFKKKYPQMFSYKSDLKFEALYFSLFFIIFTYNTFYFHSINGFFIHSMYWFI